MARGDLAYAEYELAICYGAAFLWHFNLFILLAGRHPPAPASRNHGASAVAGLVLSKLPSARERYSLVILIIPKSRNFAASGRFRTRRERDSGIRFQARIDPIYLLSCALRGGAVANVASLDTRLEETPSRDLSHRGLLTHRLPNTSCFVAGTRKEFIVNTNDENVLLVRIEFQMLQLEFIPIYCIY